MADLKWTAIATFTTQDRAEFAQQYLQGMGMEVRLVSAPAADLTELLEGEVAVMVTPPHVERARTLIAAEFQVERRSSQSRSPEARVKVAPLRTTEIPIEVEVIEQGDDDLWISPEDKIADRAYRVAITGLIVVPLQFYALALSAQNLRNAHLLSRSRHLKAIAAGVISVVMCWFIVMILIRWITG